MDFHIGYDHLPISQVVIYTNPRFCIECRQKTGKEYGWVEITKT